MSTTQRLFLLLHRQFPTLSQLKTRQFHTLFLGGSSYPDLVASQGRLYPTATVFAFFTAF